MRRLTLLLVAVTLAVPAAVLCAAPASAVERIFYTCHVVEVTVPPYSVGARVCPPPPIIP